MTTTLGLAIILVLSVAVLCLLLFRSREKPSVDISSIEARFSILTDGQARSDRMFREEMAKNREESASAARQDREELARALKSFGDSLVRSSGEIAGLQKNQLDAFSGRLETLSGSNGEKMDAVRQAVEVHLQSLQSAMAERHSEMRNEAEVNRRTHREEIAASLGNFGDLQRVHLESVVGSLRSLTTSNETKLEGLRNTVGEGLREIRVDNARQLGEMRATVEEKLQGTLEKRLGESFKHVAERLEQVHKGLGEMQTLATGVGDLKKLFANVRARGAWGEVQLDALLADMLTPDQYQENVATKEGSSERVEFAIRLPGGDHGGPLYLPIDAKFPLDDYQRLVEAQEKADLLEIESAGRRLEARIRTCAKEISQRYLDPPRTTDLALMFLPSEALYAEIARRTGVLEIVRREHRVAIVGPSTLAVTLNAFRMGFRTLAIQKRSSEVWILLGAVKTEFGRFGGLLDGVKKKLDQASDGMDGVAKRSRAIHRRLREVEVLPESEARALLGDSETDEAEAAEKLGDDEEPDIPSN
jgi:DNA recombination protein RmuC